MLQSMALQSQTQLSDCTTPAHELRQFNSTQCQKSSSCQYSSLNWPHRGQGDKAPDRLKPSVQSPGAQHCWVSRAVCDTLNALLELPPGKLSVFLHCGF